MEEDKNGENSYSNCYNIDNVLAFHNAKVSQVKNQKETYETQNVITNKITQEGNLLLLQMSIDLGDETISFENKFEFHSKAITSLDQYIVPQFKSQRYVEKFYQGQQSSSFNYVYQKNYCNNQQYSNNNNNKDSIANINIGNKGNEKEDNSNNSEIMAEESSIYNYEKVNQMVKKNIDEIDQECKQEQEQENEDEVVLQPTQFKKRTFSKCLQKQKNPYYGQQRERSDSIMTNNFLWLDKHDSITSNSSYNSQSTIRKKSNFSMDSRKYSSYSQHSRVTQPIGGEDDSSDLSSFDFQCSKNQQNVNLDQLKEFGIFTNRKNAVKNIVKAFNRYLQSPGNEQEILDEINNNSSNVQQDDDNDGQGIEQQQQMQQQGMNSYKVLRDLRKFMNRLERKRKYNQQLIYTIYTQDKLNGAFKVFLNNHSFKWLNESKIQDQDIYFSVLQDYQNLFNKLV